MEMWECVHFFGAHAFAFLRICAFALSLDRAFALSLVRAFAVSTWGSFTKHFICAFALVPRYEYWIPPCRLLTMFYSRVGVPMPMPMPMPNANAKCKMQGNGARICKEKAAPRSNSHQRQNTLAWWYQKAAQFGWRPLPGSLVSPWWRWPTTRLARMTRWHLLKCTRKSEFFVVVVCCDCCGENPLDATCTIAQQLFLLHLKWKTRRNGYHNMLRCGSCKCSNAQMYKCTMSTAQWYSHLKWKTEWTSQMRSCKCEVANAPMLKQMHQCSNAQMHKCQMLKCQMLKCTNAKCSNAQMHKYSMHKCSNTQMHKCSNA